MRRRSWASANGAVWPAPVASAPLGGRLIADHLRSVADRGRKVSVVLGFTFDQTPARGLRLLTCRSAVGRRATQVYRRARKSPHRRDSATLGERVVGPADQAGDVDLVPGTLGYPAVRRWPRRSRVSPRRDCRAGGVSPDGQLGQPLPQSRSSGGAAFNVPSSTSWAWKGRPSSSSRCASTRAGTGGSTKSSGNRGTPAAPGSRGRPRPSRGRRSGPPGRVTIPIRHAC